MKFRHFIYPVVGLKDWKPKTVLLFPENTPQRNTKFLYLETSKVKF